VRDFTDNINVMSMVVPSVPAIDFSPDSDDNLILVTAIAGDVNLIVSGDRQDRLAL
jgi:predicted nucleic acid-binding protein